MLLRLVPRPISEVFLGALNRTDKSQRGFIDTDRSSIEFDGCLPSPCDRDEGIKPSGLRAPRPHRYMESLFSQWRTISTALVIARPMTWLRRKVSRTSLFTPFQGRPSVEKTRLAGAAFDQKCLDAVCTAVASSSKPFGKILTGKEGLQLLAPMQGRAGGLRSRRTPIAPDLDSVGLCNTL
ncbi:MAG: hypothetical protein Q9210_006375 [Variospora velana]